METPEKLIVENVPWSDDAAEVLASATLTASVEDYRRQVEAGAALFRVVTETGDLVGFYILRIDALATQNVGVLVAAAGRAGVSLADTLHPVIEQQFIGCDVLIQYCARPGMVKKLIKQGWEVTHIAMRKVVKNG